MEPSFNLKKSDCIKCKHFDALLYTCPAYPKGIPENIYKGLEKHGNIKPNQVGETVFEMDSFFEKNNIFN